MAVEQQVLWLQVAVDDVVRVQVVEGEGDLGSVELGDGVGEALGLAQQTEQLAALDKVHDHVQVLAVLEGAPQGDEEGVLDLLQHATLVVGVLDLLHLDDLRLLQHLDGIEALVVLALHEMHTPEAASAERALDGEVGQRVLALGDARLVQRLRLELHAAVLGGIGGVGVLLLRRHPLLRLLLRGIGRVYEVLYAGDVVGRRLLRVGVRARDGVRAVGGVHRVGRLVRRGRRGMRGVLLLRRGGLLLGRLRVGLLLTDGVAVGAVVGARLGQVEGARGAVLGGGWGDGRARRRFFDGRRRRIEVLGAARVLRPLLLEESEGRHATDGATMRNASPALRAVPWGEGAGAGGGAGAAAGGARASSAGARWNALAASRQAGRQAAGDAGCSGRDGAIERATGHYDMGRGARKRVWGAQSREGSAVVRLEASRGQQPASCTGSSRLVSRSCMFRA